MQKLKKFKLDKNESFVVHVIDEEQGEVLLRILDSMGFKWSGGFSLLEETHYKDKSSIAYEIQEGEGNFVVYYSSLGFYERYYEVNCKKYTHALENPVRLEAYKIYSFEDAISRDSIYQII